MCLNYLNQQQAISHSTRPKYPLSGEGTFRIVIRKRTLKIRTRYILFRIARQFQRNKVRIFIFSRSRDNHGWKSWNITKTQTVPLRLHRFYAYIRLLLKTNYTKCSPFIPLSESKRIFNNSLRCPRYHDFRDTPISTYFSGILFGVADCRICAFRPLFCPLLRFFLVSYVSRPCISIQMGLDT